MDANRKQIAHAPRRAGSLSVLLTLAALVCLLLTLAVTANAETIASGYCGGEGDGTNLTWTLDSDGTLTISGEGKMADYNADSGQLAPWCEDDYRLSLKKLVLTDGVGSIGRHAFYGCISLFGKLTIPNSVTTIEYNAFYKTSFSGTLIIPNSVTNIGVSAFEGCSRLTGELIIPDSVLHIGPGAFMDCRFSKFTVSPGNPNYSSDSYGVLFNKNKTELVSYPKARDECNYQIPNGVTHIESYAFYCCYNMTRSLTIPDSVTDIGDYAFYCCYNMTGSLIIPDSVTNIGWRAFYRCSGFTGNLFIPGSIARIKVSAFSGCTGLTSVTIADGVKEIWEFAFESCEKLSTLQIPISVTKIEMLAFSDCPSLQTIYYDGTKEQLSKMYRFPSNVKIICTQNAGANGTVLSFSQKEFTAPFGSEVLLTLNITSAPGKAQEQLDSITWTSSNSAVFPENTWPSVGTQNSAADWRFRSIIYDLEDTTGDIFLTATPETPGTTVVTLMTDDGATATCTVTVAGGYNTVTMDSSEYKLSAGSSGEVFAQISNGEARDCYTWEWSSSDESVVELTGAKTGSYLCAAGKYPEGRHDARMTFRAKNPGTAILTCKLDNGLSTSRTITVLSTGSAEKEPTIESNHYDRPKYRNPQQAKNIYILDEYRSKLYDAYDAYMKALETGVDKLKAGEYGEASSITDQADALQALDEKRADKFLTPDPGMPDRYLDYCYQALCTCLLESTQSAISLSKLDISTTYKADSNIVKEIAKKVNSTKKKLSYPTATIQVGFTSYFGASFGKMTVTENGLFGRSYTVVICSVLDDVNELVADYLNELKKLERSAINNIYRTIVKDVFGQTLSSFTEKYLASKFRSQFKDFFAEHGFGAVDKTLGNLCSFYESLEKVRNHVQNPDLYNLLDPEKVMNQCLVSYDGISDKLAKSAAKKLAKVQKEIVQAIVDYRESGSVTEPKGPGFWELLFGIQCPVSVAVYDENGVQIGYVGDDDLWYNDSLYIETDGDAKLIYSLNEQTISLKITGTGYGAVNCMLEKWADGEPVYRTNYYDIAVESGSEILAGSQAYALLEQNAPCLTVDGRQVYADEQISAAQSACVTVSAGVNNDNGGDVTGGGAYVRGNPVLFRAYPSEGYDFIGWYDADLRLISVESCYEFTAREPVALTAFFASHEPSLENYLVELSAAYEGRCTITVDQTDTEYTLSIVGLDDTLDLSSFSVYAAQYDQTGRMLDVCVLPRQISGQSAIFTGSISRNGATLFILDTAGRPVAQAIVSD